MKITKINYKKAFTLIELLVVISIIALLSSIVLAALNDARAKARDSRRIQDLKQVQNALELFRADYGKYPYKYTSVSTVNGWKNELVGNSSAIVNTKNNIYIKEISSDILYRPLYQNGTLLSSCTGSSQTCSEYNLAVSLETDHPILKSLTDVDTDNNATALSGVEYYIDGISAKPGCIADTTAVKDDTDRCYDIYHK